MAEQKSFFQKALEDPYFMQVPSQRPEIVPVPAATGKPAPAAPLRTSVVKKLRSQYPDLDDLGDDELLKGVHTILVEDKVLTPESTPEDMLRHLGRSGVVIQAGARGRTGPAVSAKQLNVPVLPETEVPSERVWPDLVKKHWPELADLDAKEVLRGMFKEKRKNKTLTPETTFDQFLTSLVGKGEAVRKGAPGKFVRGLATGIVEPLFVAPVEAAGSLLAAGAEETPEAEALRKRGVEAAGRAAGAFLTVPMAAAEALGSEALIKAGVSAKELIAHQIASNAKALGLFNALTTTGEVAPEMAAGDMNLGEALGRIGLSTAIGAASGAVLGPVLGGLAHPARIAARNEAAKVAAQAEVAAARSKAIQTFINDFKPEWLRTRFADDMNLTITGAQGERAVANNEEIARSILSKVLNVKPEEVPADMLIPMMEKIVQSKDLAAKDALGLGAKVYPEINPPSGPEMIAQPVGAPLEIRPGMAPEPRAMEPSPLAEPMRPFTPPAAVEPVPGMEPVVPAAAAPEPIVPEVRPTVPTAQPKAEVPPAAAALPREGGMAPEPREVLPQAPSAAGVEAPVRFEPPKVKKIAGVEGAGAPVRAVDQFVERIHKTQKGVTVRAGSEPQTVRIESIRNAGEGTSTESLQKLTAEADLAGNELTVDVKPIDSKGGRIPVEKLVEWYKAQGFEVVSEGPGSALMRRPAVARTPVADAVVKAMGEEGPAVTERVTGVENTEAGRAAGNVEAGKPMIRGVENPPAVPSDRPEIREMVSGMRPVTTQARKPGPHMIEITLKDVPGMTKEEIVEAVYLHGLSVAEKGGNKADFALIPPGGFQSAEEKAWAPAFEALKQKYKLPGLSLGGRGVVVFAERAASLGQRVEKQLDLFASAAEERLNKKLGRLQTGFDPTMIVDLSIIGAAKMFKLGMRSYKAFSEAMTKAYGEGIAPHLKDIHKKALSVLERSISGGPTKKQLEHLMTLAQSGRHGMGWYDKTAKWAEATFGEDADMFLRFLAATSADSATEAGATMALKAYTQWKLGLPFDGFRSRSMVMNLTKAARGEQFGGDKIDSFYRALRGDKDAVVLDRWMMRALGFKNAPGSFGNQQYRMFTEVVRDLADQAGMSTREFQAAIWEGQRVATTQERFAKGGPKGAAQIGSARPLEDLVTARLGGKSPLQWVEQNNLTANTLKNVSDGLRAAKEQGGYTFNPFTWEADKTPGYIVTLASDVVPKNLFYSPALMDFRKRFAQHIEQSAAGDMFRGGQHLNVGVWNMGENKPGHYSMDLNIVLPESMKDQAMKLGLANKQFEIGHISPEGNFTGIKTGYDPKVHGPQDVPPPLGQTKSGGSVQGGKRLGWFERANARVGRLLDEIGPYTMESAEKTGILPDAALKYMVANPQQALAHAGEVLGKSTEEMKALIDKGEFRPMSDAGVEGRLFVNRDGTVWEYVDPKGPSYNTTRLFGSLRGGKLTEVLERMEGREVIRGQEFLDNYRGQAGYIGGGRPSDIRRVIAQSKNSESAVRALTRAGAKPVASLGALKYAGGKTQFEGQSLWLAPDGRVYDAMTTHAKNSGNAKLKNPVSYEGSESDAVQAALNYGLARIQLHKDLLAMDATTPLTAAQVNTLKAIRGDREFGGRVVNPNGTHDSFTQDFNEFVTTTRENIMRLLRAKPVEKPKPPKFSPSLVTAALVRSYGKPFNGLDPDVSAIMLPNGKFVQLSNTDHHMAARDALAEFVSEADMAKFDPMQLLQQQGYARVRTGGENWDEFVIDLSRKPTAEALQSLKREANAQVRDQRSYISYELTDPKSGKTDSGIGVEWDEFADAVKKFFK